MMDKCVKETAHWGMDFKASEKDTIALNAQDVQSSDWASLLWHQLTYVKISLGYESRPVYKDKFYMVEKILS